jgi:hypothetical protein
VHVVLSLTSQINQCSNIRLGEFPKEIILSTAGVLQREERIMKKTIIVLLTILGILITNNQAGGQHYTDWEGFEFLPIANELYELRKDYTISLPEYYQDFSPSPDDPDTVGEFIYNWVKNSLPACDWDFVRLEEGGILTIKRGYRWDGPSYPNREHSYFNCRSSMVHDALYDLMRMDYMEADHNHLPGIYIPFYGFVHPDEHSWSDTGDCNRFITDMMIYMIAVEDGQQLEGMKGARMDVSVIRFGGAPSTYDLNKLERWKYHVSELTAYASDGRVDLKWKVADYSGKDPNYDDHFHPYATMRLFRNGSEIAMMPPTVTQWVDHDVDNGTAYRYQIIPDPVNGNEYDYTLEEHVIPSNGPGNALFLDGIDDYVEADVVSNDLVGSEGFNGAMAMEAWVYPEDQSGQAIILAFNTIDYENYNLLSYDGSNHTFCYYDSDNGYICSSGDFPPGEWYHVAITLDELDNGIILVNGEEQLVFTASIRPSHGARFSIGQEWDNSGTSQHFKGLIDEVRLWNIARTQEEIGADMYHPIFGDEAGLIGLWHFDEPNFYPVMTGLSLEPPGLVRKAFDGTSNKADGRLRGYMVNPQETAFVPSGAMDRVTDVDDDDQDNRLPLTFELAQNYPNPFNPTTTIEYSLPRRSHVTIEVLNLLGQRVRILVDREEAAGFYNIIWDGTGSDGREVSTGVYFYRIRAENYVETRKMLLLK